MRAILKPVPAPTGANFDGAPTLAPTEGGYELSFTLTGADTVSGVLVPPGSSTPSAAQIHDGQNQAGGAALRAASKTVDGGVASKLNLEGQDYPIADVHFAVGTHVVSFTDQLKLPPAGSQYVTVDLGGGSIPAESLWYPDTATGDVAEMPLAVSPSGVPFSEVTGKGGFSLATALTGRQYIDLRTYDYSAQDWLAVTGLVAGEFGRIYLNNDTPTEILPIPDQQWYTGIPIGDIRLDAVHVRDLDNDVLAYALDNALPTGVSIVQIVDQDGPYSVIRGMPELGTAGTTSHTLTVTDVALEQLVMTPFGVTVIESVAVPDVIGEDLDSEDGLDAVINAGLDVIVIYIKDFTVTARSIISTQPPAGERVTPGTQVAVYVSGASYSVLSPKLRDRKTGKLYPPGTVVGFRVYLDGGVGAPTRRLPDYFDDGTVVDNNGQITLGSTSGGNHYYEIYQEAADKTEDVLMTGQIVF
jgi:hypothetical protein